MLNRFRDRDLIHRLGANDQRDETADVDETIWDLQHRRDGLLQCQAELRLPFFMLLGLIAAIIIRPWDFVPALASLKPVTVSLLGITAYLVASGQTIAFLRLPLSRCLLVIWVVMLLGIFNPYQTAPVMDFAIKYVQFLLLFALIGSLVLSAEALMWTHRTLCGVSLVLGALAVRARMAGEFSVDGRIEGLGEGLLADPNDLASMLVTLVPLVWYHASTETSALDRLLGLGALVSLLVGVVITESRGGLIALIAVAGWLLMTSRASIIKKLSVIAIVGGIGVALLPDDIANRYATITSAAQTDESAQSRLAVWMAGARMFQDHPLFGVGVTNFEIVYGSRYIDRVGAGDIWRSAHNSAVEAAAELGAIGLLAWLMFMCGPVWVLWRARRRLGAATRELDASDQAVERWEEASEDDLVRETRRAEFWCESMMASVIGFLVSAMFLSKAFDISTVIFVGLAVAGARWVHRAAELREDVVEASLSE
ncbi:MAG: O-antigen ligase family protein [Planctomycetota bacterium]